jgi:hypothetical protein
LKKTILAIPVPTIPKIIINTTECCTFSTCITSEKPVKYNIAKEGNSNTRKLPVVMLTGLKSDKTFD